MTHDCYNYQKALAATAKEQIANERAAERAREAERRAIKRLQNPTHIQETK